MEKTKKAKTKRSSLYSTKETEYARLLSFLRIKHPKVLIEYRKDGEKKEGEQ